MDNIPFNLFSKMCNDFNYIFIIKNIITLLYITKTPLSRYNYNIDYIIIIWEVFAMGKLVIKSDVDAIKSINRTIRIKPECFDKLMELAEKHNISFNKVVCQCLDYALENLEE